MAYRALSEEVSGYYSQHFSEFLEKGGMLAVYSRILSLEGPSSVSLGATQLGTVFRNFSTATYLDLYEADPIRGTLIVPAIKRNLSSKKEDREIFSTPLTPQTFPDFLPYAFAANLDGWKIYDAQASKSGAETIPYPLPATSGDWILSTNTPQVARNISAIFDDGSKVGNKLGGITLLHSLGKMINFHSLAHPAGSHIQVGWLGSDTAVQQLMYIDPQNQVFTEGYQFEFRGRGVEGLRKYLGLSMAPLFYLALEIAGAIYTSDQYVPMELGFMHLWDGRQRHRLDFDGRTFFGPEDIEPHSDHYTIRSQGSVDETAPEQMKLPLFNFKGSVNQEGSETLSVNLFFPLFQMYPALKPLKPSLMRTFWDHACPSH
jgi:hypothetical protein